MRTFFPLLIVGLLGSACSDESQESTPAKGGSAPVECATSDKPIDGGCQPPGVPAERCAPGFESDDAGCFALLPAAPCPFGSMALPGDTSCRETAPCGAGDWGDIPVDGNTQFVNQAFAGASNGTEAAPWTTIQQGIDAAAAGAIVAVASGSYLEDLNIQSKSVRLWGKCPSEVSINGAGAGTAVFVRQGADGSEIHDIAVTGPAWGIAVSGSIDVLLQRVWVHDTDRGLDLESALGPTAVTVRGSLIELASDQGILAAGVALTIEDSIVRDTQPGPGNNGGYGMSAQNDINTGAPTTLVMRNTIFERNFTLGMLLYGPTATLDGVVVRDTLPQASNNAEGRGIGIEDDSFNNVRANVTITGSVVERNPEFGIFCSGSDVIIETTTVRDTFAEASTQQFGRCITVQENDVTGEISSLIIRESLVERCLDTGINVAGSMLEIESLLIRDVWPRALDQIRGRGLNVQAGVLDVRSMGSVGYSSIERVYQMGVLAVDSDLVVNNMHVADVFAQPVDNTFGDGFVVMTRTQPASAIVTASRVDRAARAGIANFSALVSMSDNVLNCNAIQLNGEALNGVQFNFDDSGDNTCTCAGAEADCKVLSENLEPPEPVEDGQ